MLTGELLNLFSKELIQISQNSELLKAFVLVFIELIEIHQINSDFHVNIKK